MDKDERYYELLTVYDRFVNGEDKDWIISKFDEFMGDNEKAFVEFAKYVESEDA